MMDDIYQAGVLTTHQRYMRELPACPAAVTWAKQVIGKVKARGWPEARIFAATDRPLNPENNPGNSFERAGHRSIPGRETTPREGRGRRTPLRQPDPGGGPGAAWPATSATGRANCWAA